jgi:protein tyrosine phosphatase
MGQRPSNNNLNQTKEEDTSKHTSSKMSKKDIGNSATSTSSNSDSKPAGDKNSATKEPIKKNIYDDPKYQLQQWKELEREEFEKNGVLDESRFTAALLKENYDKNRYYSVLAPDKTRVKLKKIGDITGSDYINANFVDGIHADGKAAYIASQAPLPLTFHDFWRMIWEQRVEVIAMLTKLEEGKVLKAHRYWPTKGTKEYGDITVTLVSNKSKHNDSYRVKVFTVQRDNETRTVTQYHYLSWPDHGVPPDPHPLLEMMSEIEAERSDKQKTKTPMVVHCSAGIGRTGTFIVIHTVLSKMRQERKYSLETLNLQPLVSTIRDQRPGCLTQNNQFFFCYKAIAVAVQNKYTWIMSGAESNGTHDKQLPTANVRDVNSLDPNENNENDAQSSSSGSESGSTEYHPDDMTDN